MASKNITRISKTDLPKSKVFLGRWVIVDKSFLNYSKTFAHVFEELDVDIVVQVGEADLFWLYWKHIVFVHLADFVGIMSCDLRIMCKMCF